jgi:hypothetical protein
LELGKRKSDFRDPKCRSTVLVEVLRPLFIFNVFGINKLKLWSQNWMLDACREPLYHKRHFVSTLFFTYFWKKTYSHMVSEINMYVHWECQILNWFKIVFLAIIRKFFLVIIRNFKLSCSLMSFYWSHLVSLIFCWHKMSALP